MCAAIPVGLFLLFLLVVGTIFRFSRPCSPNASTLASLMKDALGGVDDGIPSVESLTQPYIRSPSVSL